MPTAMTRHSLLLFFLASALVGCQVSAQSAAVPSAIPPAQPTVARPTSLPATALPDPITATTQPPIQSTSQITLTPTAATPTFLPEQRISIALNGRTWHLSQPVGIAPVVAQGSTGILWIAFPYMRAVAPPTGDGVPRPLDAYFVMYTPLTGPGDDLDATGYRIAPLASETDDAERSLVALTPLEHSRFLLVSRRLCQGCQNGGTLEFWRIDPALSGQPESFVSLLELPGDGGGHFLAFASGPRWLLWSAADLADLAPATPAKSGEVELLDLESGRKHSIAVNEPYGVEQAEWGTDGHFHLTMRQTHHQYMLDPNSGQITHATTH